MLYYQILKKRRLDLNLSVQDIAIQTHLAPEFIRAIEENNLDAFADDLSYVRYFVRAYAEALGVNWQAIAAEVDYSIELYARARDQAITQAQRIMAAQMQAQQASKSKGRNKKSKNRKASKSTARKSSSSRPKSSQQAGKSASANRPAASSKNTKKKKARKPRRKRSVFQSSASRISRWLNWSSRDRLTKVVVILVVIGLGIMVGLNYMLDSYSARAAQEQSAAKEAELLAKEEETQRLANQYQSQKQQEKVENGTNPILTAVPAEGDSGKVLSNTYYLTNLLGVSDELVFSFKADSGSYSVTVTTDGEEDFSEEVSSAMSKTLTISSVCTIDISFTNWSSSDSVTISGTALPVDSASFTDGSGTVTLEVVWTVPTPEKEEDEDSEEADGTEQTQDEQLSGSESEVQYDAWGNVIQDNTYDTGDSGDAGYDTQTQTQTWGYDTGYDTGYDMNSGYDYYDYYGGESYDYGY